MRTAVELKHAWRMFNHGPVTLVTAAHDGVENVMAAAWVTPLDFDPPKLTVVLAAATFTRSLVDRSRELVLQVPTVSMLAVVEGVGSVSGHQTDKWTRFEIAREREPGIAAPLISGCTAWVAARVLDEPTLAERYDLFVVEGYAAWADERVYERGRLREEIPHAMRSLHHVAGGVYIVDGEVVRAPRDASSSGG